MIPTSTSRLGLLPPPTTESMPRSGKYTLSIFRLAISIVLRRSRATGSSRGWGRGPSSADMAASSRFLNLVGGFFGDKALALCMEARARGVSLSAVCAPEGRLQAMANFTPVWQGAIRKWRHEAAFLCTAPYTDGRFSLDLSRLGEISEFGEDGACAF